MTSARKIDAAGWTGFGPARVAAVGPANRLTVESDGAVVEAALAVPGYEPRAGDRVLLARGDDRARYVIGVLGALRPVVRASGGACAELSGEAGQESIAVRDARGALLFEYRPAEERCVVHAPHALQLHAENVELVAEQALKLRARRVEVDGEHLRTRAARAEVELGDGKLVAKTLSTTAERVRQLAGVLDVRVTRLIERAHDVYREAEGLSQTRAGRLKLFARGTLHAFGKRALLKAEQDLKLDGDKIHLG